ncbi:conserved hypothetical protein [Streptomyces sviceus ATCC 29083]|uniref:Uncharacterized protein n=1 Tax=Streptomyces sviceus (strain ATCC 29083 / DSM 924 / JCM 4929 / NBRC 13980 / NCIMB 11184 / NRRL 5439 / UC 5370) TaxID=463191 RepID=B5HY56_STRX2|nr:conserved hypothetical protein [Streptomyces sviceus ATCC 29083]
MYALIVPASTPFVLLAVVMALSWWEDHILPTSPTEPAEPPAEAPFPPAAPAQLPRVLSVDPTLTGAAFHLPASPGPRGHTGNPRDPEARQ